MFVILQPHSNTNPSDNYRVVDSSDWARYVNGASNSIALAGQFNNYDDALALRDDLNSDPVSCEIDVAIQALNNAIGDRDAQEAYRDPAVREADAALSALTRNATLEELAAWAERDHRKTCVLSECPCKARM